MKKILVTGSLFISPDQEQILRESSFSVERLVVTKPTEAELIAAIKDKVGYILGGDERVTRKVIDAATKLKAIAFCGTDYEYFIPAWDYATKKGITLTNVPDGHTHAVAEWAQGAALSMNRGFFGQGSYTTVGLEGQTIGIIGLGHIGTRLKNAWCQPPTIDSILQHSSSSRPRNSSGPALCRYDDPAPEVRCRLPRCTL